MSEPVVLKGARLILRPFDASQVHERYLGWLSDPTVNHFSQRRGAPPVSADEARAYLSSLGKDELILGMHCPVHGHVGNIKYGPVDWRNCRADIAILIGETAVWGKGYGTEAIYLVSRHLFESLLLNRVDAGSTNPGFLKAVAKLGWKVEGVMRERVKIGDALVDWTYVAQLRREFVRRPELEQPV